MKRDEENLILYFHTYMRAFSCVFYTYHAFIRIIKSNSGFNPNPFSMVHYKHALLLCLCSWSGLLWFSRRVTGIGLRINLKQCMKGKMSRWLPHTRFWLHHTPYLSNNFYFEPSSELTVFQLGWSDQSKNHALNKGKTVGT